MDLLVGILALVALAAALTLAAACFDDRLAIYLSDRLIARVAGRVAYRERYQAVLAERERA